MNDLTKTKVICVVGPTASGKSALAIDLAHELGGQIVSADSMQIYRHMNIGTAKLPLEEQTGIPHYMMDVVDPSGPFTVADWVQGADSAIRKISVHGDVPIVAGGTGLYVRGITNDLDFASHRGADAVRNKWQEFSEKHGVNRLHEELAKVDPESAERLHPNDVRRVIRALEVYELGEGPLSKSYDWSLSTGRYHTLQFGLTMDRELLYRRCDTRVDQMLKYGLVEEVKKLLDSGVTPQAQSMQAIGYKEIALYLRHELGFEEAVETVKRSTRRYVKRQLSWFRRDTRIHWLHVDDETGLDSRTRCDVLSQCREFLAGISASQGE